MLNRRLFLGAQLAALAGCAAKKPSAPVRVQAGQYVQAAPLHLAVEAGFFKDEGLAVEIEESEGARTSIPLLAGGQADVAFSSPSPQLINALGRGARIRVAAGRLHYSPECGDARRVYGSRKAFPDGFTDFAQMKGKRVAVEARINIQAYAFHLALKKGGLTRDDVTIVREEDREAAVMLATGSVDVSFVANTVIQLASVLKDVVEGPTFYSIIPNFRYGYVVFGKRLLDDAPEDGTRFLRAYLRGCREFLAGRTPKYLTELAEKEVLNKDAVLKHCRSDTTVDGSIDDSEVQAFIDWGVAEGHISSPVAAKDVIDRRFLEEIHG